MSFFSMDSWDRKTWRLATPLILTNISIPLLGAVDTAVVGHLPGPHHLGAVAIGGLIFGFVFGGLNFLRMGTTGLTAQAVGAKDPNAIRAWLGRAAFIAIVIGLILIACQSIIGWAALKVMAPSEMVTPLAEKYFGIRIWSAPATLMNFAMLGWFFGIQNTRAALITQIFMNGANIILDLWFVMGLGWGVEGVAWATLMSEFMAVALGLLIISGELKKRGGHWDLGHLLDRAPLLRMIKTNSNIFIRSMCLQGSFIVFTSIGARTNDTILAANAILLLFQYFMGYALDGFATAAEALAGEAVGAKNRITFRLAVKATSRWALIFAIAFSFAFYFGGEFLISILTDVEIVRETAREYLFWTVISPLISVWSFQFDGIFIGATRTADMRNGMLVSLLVFIIALMLLFPAYGNHGLWFAFLIFMAARGVTLGFLYPRLEKSITT